MRNFSLLRAGVSVAGLIGGIITRVMLAGATNTSTKNLYQNQVDNWSFIREQLHTRPYDINIGEKVILRLPTTLTQGPIHVLANGDTFPIPDPVDWRVDVAPTWVYQQNKSGLAWSNAPASAADGGGVVVHYTPAGFSESRPWVDFEWTATAAIPANTPFGVRTFTELPEGRTAGVVQNKLIANVRNTATAANTIGRFEGVALAKVSLIDEAASGTFRPSAPSQQGVSPMGVGTIIAPAPAGSPVVAIWGNSIESDSGALDGYGALDVSGGYSDLGGNMKGSTGYAMRLYEKLGVLHTNLSRGSDAMHYRVPAKARGTIAPVNSGTATGARTTTAALAVGTTLIPLDTAGTGTILVDGYVKFSFDQTTYKVTVANTDVSTGGTFTITPGLKVAQPAGTKRTITLAGSLLTVTQAVIGGLYGGLDVDPITTTVAGQKLLGQYSNSTGLTGVYALLLPETAASTVLVTGKSRMTYDLAFIAGMPGISVVHGINKVNEMSKSISGASWQANRSYIRDEGVSNGGYLYIADNDGVSGSSGGPTGTGAGIADNGLTWTCVGPADLANNTQQLGYAYHMGNLRNYVRMIKTAVPGAKYIDVTTTPSVTSSRAATSYSYNSTNGILTIGFDDVTDMIVGNGIGLAWSATPTGFSVNQATTRRPIASVDTTAKTIGVQFPTGLTAPATGLTLSVGIGAPSVASQTPSATYLPGNSLRTMLNRYTRSKGTPPYNDVGTANVFADLAAGTEHGAPTTVAGETGVWRLFNDGTKNVAFSTTVDYAHTDGLSSDLAAVYIATPAYSAGLTA